MAWWLFQNLVATGLLALVIALVGKTTRIGPVGRHALWLIVLIKFVTPPVLVWPWAAPDPFGVATFGAHAAERAVTESGDVAIAPGAATASSLDGAQARATVAPARAEAAPASPEPLDQSLAQIAAAGWPWIIALWVLGSLCVVMIEAIRLLRLARVVSAASPGPPAIVDRVRTLSAQLGLRAVPVVAMADKASPAIWCVGRPKLLWPSDLAADSTEASIDGLLVHELAHVQRRDHFVGWIELVAGVIWWWNPLFWFVRSALREQAELACDAWVISALPNGRRAYAESLLALSSAAVQEGPLMTAAVIGIRANNRRVLERRLVMIMQGRASVRVSMVGLVCLALMAGATLPVWASSLQQVASPVPPVTAAVPQPVPNQAPTPTPPGAVAVAPQAPMPVSTMATPQTSVPVQPVLAVRHLPIAPTQPHLVAAQQLPAAPAPHVFTASQQPPVVQRRVLTAPVAQRPVVASRVTLATAANLPSDGQDLLKKFEADRDAIQQEVDKKIEARKAEFLKALQALQDQYTKAGKLDEAIAIRDFIRSGAGDGPLKWIRR